ncbi:AraC family transcriptional regulator [Chondrinema litorale]|uniref:AraC family transcriptional regulator n=1 Tax=Chondrinema litorale TaxID=2994555 RepID=UPI002542F97E|nr:helix-turn-helix domain-containing protein [Chondrinema litorale]UZR97070.1 helix-turn-helix transcriptional regulator [Chondrinema litorale]
MNGKQFTIKTMQDIEESLQGEVDTPHRHDYYTIIWAKEASGKHFIDFKEYAIENNSVFFISPGQVHQVIANVNPTGCVITFTPEFLTIHQISEDFINDLKIFRNCDENPPLILDESKRDKISVYTNLMIDVVEQRNSMYEEQLGALLKLFLIECNNVCVLDKTNNRQLSSGEYIYRNFRKLVDKHFFELHKVSDYADQLNITAGHLNSVVKQYLGKSAKEYIQERLILEAKRLLAYSDMNAKEIGYALGFDDPSNFSKFFRKMSSLSTAQFRQEAVLS